MKMLALVEDRVTGFRGIVTGHCEYATGCSQSLVQPQVKETGEWQEAKWFDDQRCRLIQEQFVQALDNEQTPGADLPAPIR